MIIKTEAIVLRSKRYSESSLICSAYSLEKGKISLIAKGALRPKSKFASTLMPLSYVHLQYYEKRNGLGTASDAEPATTYHNLSQSYEHLTIGLLILETVDLKQEDENPDARLFAMLKHSLGQLNETPNNPRNLLILFQYHFATLSGYKIQIKNLPEVIEEHEDSGFVSFYHEEGKVCHFGRTFSNNSFTFRTQTFMTLRKIIAAGYNEYHIFAIEEDEFYELIHFFISYFSYHLEQKVEFKTLSLIN